ncbi:uncharacterized protein LOC116852486 isoform X2 [Odontomachus brunneus]|uniref:uncharacterized protein LOC116852486 isoform X2 n=1 Tax=Odontomachus brunneus TaxID=486640 RepID=UPI0013F2176D|nr:uncharacterized protein LOC116852486 isoform X2 [Odontomachus brunneus]
MLRSRLLSRMSTDVSTVSSTLLTLLLIILSPIYGKDIGEGCIIDNSSNSPMSGICKLLQNCPSVYEELLAGKTPDTSCGFLGFEPIVCCPKDTVITTKGTTKGTTLEPNTNTERINTPHPWIFDNTRGSLARANIGLFFRWHLCVLWQCFEITYDHNIVSKHCIFNMIII